MNLPSGSELLNAVFGADLCDINVAVAINGDSIERFKLSYAGKESAVGRKFFDTSVTRVGDQNISACDQQPLQSANQIRPLPLPYRLRTQWGGP